MKKTIKDDSLLLELPVPFRVIDGKIYAEFQASNGLARWLDNFERVTVCAPLIPDAHINSDNRWQDMSEIMNEGRLKIILLPWGYGIGDHFRDLENVRRILRNNILSHQYLVFCNLGWLGAWGNIAAEEAVRLGRPYAVWLDWVLHDMPEQKENNFLKSSWRQIQRQMLKIRSLNAIKNASLGLFHGRTVFDGYSSYCKNSYLVHDIHLKASDIIDRKQLERRIDSKISDFRIGYVGRVHPMKDPISWISAIEKLIDLADGQYAIKATWMGGGPLLEECRELIERRGLSSNISFPGIENDRQLVIDFLRSSDIFMFCHVTPESPRCLIEALMSGLPLIGFESEYAKDLVAEHGGGKFVPIGAISELALLVHSVFKSEVEISELTYAAFLSGSEFSDEAVFRHRAQLIKLHL